MARAAPQIFNVSVEFEGRDYSAHWVTFSGVVMLLHPDFGRGGIIARYGIPPVEMAQKLLLQRLEGLKSKGELHDA